MLKGKLLDRINSGQQSEVEPKLRGKGLTIGHRATELAVVVSSAEALTGEESVASQLEYLHGLAELGLEKGVGWESLLSGETLGSNIEPSAIVSEKGALARAGSEHDKSALTLGAALKGPDYGALKEKYPRDRYKFYHSIIDKEHGEAYLAELFQLAKKSGLSLTTKVFDHAYDNPNLYTWHPNELAQIIAEVYPKYIDAFGETEHFLQGPLVGVNQKHIGWVQEPVASLELDSHSGRMGQIGRELDAHGLSEEAYRKGCEAAGVRPEAPWLLLQE